MTDIKEVLKLAGDTGVRVRVNPSNIDLLNKLLEGYDNHCMVTTLDAQRGDLVVWSTSDTKHGVIKVLKEMPFFVKFCPEEDSLSC